MTGPRTGLLGVVLAGGRSSRFGSDKADARLAGRSMLRRALDALAPHVEQHGVVLAADHRHDPSDLPRVPVRRDAVPGAGPLEGLRVALEWARDEGLDGSVVLACDLPLLDAAAVGELVRRWRTRPEGAVDGVVPVVDDLPQPLAAVYSVGALAEVETRLGGADRSLLGALRTLRIERIEAAGPPLSPDRFLNVNTPADGERALAMVQADPGPGADGR